MDINLATIDLSTTESIAVVVLLLVFLALIPGIFLDSSSRIERRRRHEDLKIRRQKYEGAHWAPREEDKGMFGGFFDILSAGTGGSGSDGCFGGDGGGCDGGGCDGGGVTEMRHHRRAADFIETRKRTR